ncbi:hypothetical protein ACFQY7_14980 [Actinomadura luteofluorescens]|uniref:hypothetical protein n=1 Tax=Actinomadura luteofluorescens TaxID=46163 RepID=UPI0036271713
MTMHGSSGDLSAPVDGRITIGDAVIGKIAAFAALEVEGVAASPSGTSPPRRACASCGTTTRSRWTSPSPSSTAR